MADGTKFYIAGELYVKVMEESTHYNAVKDSDSSVATKVMDEEIFVTEEELKDYVASLNEALACVLRN